MKYMLLIYGAEDAWTECERTACMLDSMKICDELAEHGKWIASSPLHSVMTATCVRVRNGQRQVTDGPYAETTEQLGGYYLIDVDNLDEAIAIAERLPPARRGTVEIRPLARMSGLPAALAPNALTDPSLHRFMMICYDDEQHWAEAGDETLQAAREQAVGLTKQLAEEGRFLGASPLHPSATATSVRVRDGRRQITDGPFAETREVLGGYYLLLAKDRSEVLAIAAQHPGVTSGCVEVREVHAVDATSASSG